MGRTLVSVFILCWVTSLGWAGERLVLVTDLWPPFRVEGPEGTMVGIDIDVVRVLETRLGVSITVERAPWARCLEMMKAGTADLMLGLAKTPDREAYISYLEPAYCEVRPAFYTHAPRGLVVRTYGDLAALVIGYTRGSAYFEPFDSDAKLKKMPFNQESQLLNMLRSDRIDTLIGTTPQVDYEIRLSGLDKVIVRAPYQPSATTPLYLGISLKSPLVGQQDRWSAALARLTTEGTIRNIAQKYLR